MRPKSIGCLTPINTKPVKCSKIKLMTDEEMRARTIAWIGEQILESTKRNKCD